MKENQTKEKISKKVDINYYDEEEVIKSFLYLSAKNRLNEFNFSKAFELKERIRIKLAEHGLRSYNEFLEAMSDIYTADSFIRSDFLPSTNYISFSEDECFEWVLKGMYGKYKETFEDFGTFEELEILLKDIDERNQEDYILFDRLIHAEHETGLIFDINIDELKESVELMLKEEVE